MVAFTNFNPVFCDLDIITRREGQRQSSSSQLLVIDFVAKNTEKEKIDCTIRFLYLRGERSAFVIACQSKKEVAFEVL